MPEIGLEIAIGLCTASLSLGIWLQSKLQGKGFKLKQEYREYIDASSKRMSQQDAEIGLLRSLARQIRADCDKYHSINLDAVLTEINEQSKVGIYK